VESIGGGSGRLFFWPDPSNDPLRALTQYEFLDLAGRSLWQRPEDHRPRHLEASEVLATEGDISSVVALV
jgi:hypothetical protein